MIFIAQIKYKYIYYHDPQKKLEGVRNSAHHPQSDADDHLMTGYDNLRCPPALLLKAFSHHVGVGTCSNREITALAAVEF